MAGRRWTDAENETLIAKYSSSTGAALARELGRSTPSVYRQIGLLGLGKNKKVIIDEAFYAGLRRLNAQGYCDSEIAPMLGAERHTISEHRIRLGLPSRQYGERFRSKTAENTRRQCAAAGTSSLAGIRVLAFRKFAARQGWPEDTPPRAVQILDALDALGPLTRRQIAEAIGMPWKGSRKSLVSPAGRGSYLANLIEAGLVVSLGRVVKGRGRGGSVQLYSLSPTTIRGPHEDGYEELPPSNP